MKTIYKYLLEIADRQVVEMPRKALLLSVQVQRGEPCLWALVDTTNEPELRTIIMCETGSPMIDEDALFPPLFIDTFQMWNRNMVYHVFVKE